jgi:hypothetical protein
MKKKLANYLNELETERFSGWGGGEFNMGFDGDDSGDMGYSGATGTVYATRPAKPYSITFNNSTGGAGATWVLFGFNRYQDVASYGCTVGVIITVGGGITYPELLAQSAMNNFVAVKWRFISSDATNLAQTITVTYRDANGRQIVDPIPLSIYNDAYQYSTQIIDIDYSLKIDGTSYLSGTLSASTSMTIIVFPEAIVDTAQMLNNAEPVRAYEKPVVSRAVPVTPRAIPSTVPVKRFTINK